MAVAPSPPLLLLAHATSTGIPLSSSALAYLGVAIVVLTTLALRTSWVTPRLGPAQPRPLPLTGVRTIRTAVAGVMGVAGAVVLATLVDVALAGDTAAGANLAPLAIFFALWLGTVVASVFGGEAASLWNPWLGVGGLADRRRGRSADEAVIAGPQLWWLAPFGLWTLLVLQLAWDGGANPRSMGRWLVGYCAVFGGGAVLWGREWIRRHDPFVAASRAIGTLSPIARTTDGRFGWRRPLSGLATDATDPGEPTRPTLDGLDRATVLGIAAVMIGGATFQRVRASRWWTARFINRNVAITDLAHLVGLTWFVVLPVALWLGITRAVERRAGDGTGANTTALTAALVPIALGLTVARFAELFALQIQNVVLMASDPFDKGWDLFGTINWTFNPRPFTPNARGWTQITVVGLALVAALAIAHDRLVDRHGAAAARAAQPLVALTLGAAGVASLLTLLGA